MGLVCGSLVVLLGACSFSKQLGETRANTDEDAAIPELDAPEVPLDGAPKPPAFHLRIATVIDGESYIHVKGKTAWFENRIYAAPGRWDADGAAPWDKAAIMLNTVAWQPTWPDVPNPENRDCMCLSSTTQLPVGVPAVPSTTTWKEVDVRRPQGIIQAPSSANGWELVALVSDYTVGGAYASFVLELDVVPN